MNSLKNLQSFIINLIFPHTCIICSDITSYKFYTGICINCYKKLETFNIKKHSNLSKLIKESYIDDFNAVFIYNEILAKTILDFKFNDKTQFAKSLAYLMSNKINKESLNLQDTLIIPVPIHSKRLFKRKYNQSSLLAKHISKLSKIKYSNNGLKRIKNTPHQTGQSAKVRKLQLTNAFKANESIIKNKNIILIDDVFTTGSTVNICAKELKEKGAKSVKVLTIAYTPL
jgi:ComF family protein